VSVARTAIPSGSRVLLHRVLMILMDSNRTQFFIARFEAKAFGTLVALTFHQGIFDPDSQSQLSSQRLQELDDGFLVLSLEFFELLGYVSCFAAMPQDGVPECKGCAVVHHSRAQADSP